MDVLSSLKLWLVSCLDPSLGRIGVCSGGRGMGSGLGLKLREGVHLKSELNGGFGRGGEVKGRQERGWDLREGQGVSGGGFG